MCSISAASRRAACLWEACDCNYSTRFAPCILMRWKCHRAARVPFSLLLASHISSRRALALILNSATPAQSMHIKCLQKVFNSHFQNVQLTDWQGASEPWTVLSTPNVCLKPKWLPTKERQSWDLNYVHSLFAGSTMQQGGSILVTLHTQVN